MAASVKIEFDDGSRVISQKVEDTEEGGGAERGVSRKDVRPKSCSIDVFYEASSPDPQLNVCHIHH